MARYKSKLGLLCVLLVLGYFAQTAVAIEVDTFGNSQCYIGLQLPSGGVEPIRMTGASTMEVLFSGVEGKTGDHDGDGRDDVDSRMRVFSFAGVSPTLGPVHMRLSGITQSLGVMEETANATPGILDVPPFTATGTCESFFDVFVEIEIPGGVLHNGTGMYLADVITYKPPGPGEMYHNFSPVPLLDTGGNPTGFSLVTVEYKPSPPTEVDVFDYSECQLQLNMAEYGTQTVQMTGNSTVLVFFEGLVDGSAQDDDGDGRDEVQTELAEWTLTGNNPSLGEVQLLLNSYYAPTLGEMEELANNTAGVLDVAPFTASGMVDSFFDVYLKVMVGGQVYHNIYPLRIFERISHKPPEPGNIWESMGGVQLYDTGGNPTRYYVDAAAYEANAVPPICGDAEHPYPVGDLNLDCKVDFKDFAIFALHWLECTAPECD